jgi:hypothetical protein
MYRPPRFQVSEPLLTLRLVRYALHSVEHGIYAKIDSIADLIEYLPLLLDTSLHATSKHVVERIQEAAGATT